eukprot:scaffold63151_cov49-Phaeocystis_antarctica.AAC.1
MTTHYVLLTTDYSLLTAHHGVRHAAPLHFELHLELDLPRAEARRYLEVPATCDFLSGAAARPPPHASTTMPIA